MGKRQQAAQKTRQSILEALAALGAEKGFQQLSIEEITTRAGVAKGTFYVYFKRKEDAISELSYGSFESIKARALALPGVAAQIECYLVESTRVICTTGLEIAQQWLRCAVAPLPGETHGADKLAYDTAFLADCLAAAAARGELRPATPAAALARQLVAQYYGCLALWCITGGETPMQTLMEDFCHTHLRPLLAAYANETPEK